METTEHTIGNVYPKIFDWKCKMASSGKSVDVFGIVFSNEGSNGREPLFDVSSEQTNDIFAYWKDEENGILEISALEPGYEIRAPKSMQAFFSVYPNKRRHIASSVFYLDVSHLDVSKTITFEDCFRGFGAAKNSEIIGLENWNVGNGSDIREAFCDAFPYNDLVSLDLSSWKFPENKDVFTYGLFNGFASTASKVELNLSWDTRSFICYDQMFDDFAALATEVNLIGVENWNVENGNCFNGVFWDFAPNSNCKLDLTGWSKNHFLVGDHFQFSTGSFFRIKEPKWYQDIHK